MTRNILGTMLACGLLAVLATGVARAADDAAKKQKEQELIKILTSDSPKDQKAITCKQLAVIGSAESVPALAPLLADEQLASWARIPLEAIPGVEADAALREAAGKLSGRLLIGTLNSIGVRKDAGAVELLAGMLKNPSEDAASAAAVALGKIGNEGATKVLQDSLSTVAPGVRSAVAEGCILCAEKLLLAGKGAEATQIYEAVRHAEVPKPRVLEATRGAILAQGKGGLPLLVETLRSKNRDLFNIGLSTSREIAGPEVTTLLATELGNATGSHDGVPLVYALADRQDKGALPAVLKATESNVAAVQVAAITVLTTLGDASCVPNLLKLSGSNQAAVSTAARETLSNLSGADVDAAIIARLGSASTQELPVLLAVVGQRRLPAIAELRKALDHSDAAIRLAALTALGETVELKDLEVLVQRVVAGGKTEAETAAIQAALRTASVRMPDREACAKKLVGAMASLSTPSKSKILEILADVGGENALQALRTAAKTGDSELQDTASRLLGAWFTLDAGPVLLELAQTPGNQFAVRAMRGYIKLARQSVMPDADRVVMCRSALRGTTRVAEQNLVLEVLERYPSFGMLQVAVEAAAIPALKEEATKVALVIAQKSNEKPDEALKLLAQLGQTPVKLEITKAEYGSGSTFVDVTATVRKHAKDWPVIVLPSANFNKEFGGDPTPGTPKQLKIQYKLNGKAGMASFSEDASLLLK